MKIKLQIGISIGYLFFFFLLFLEPIIHGIDKVLKLFSMLINSTML